MHAFLLCNGNSDSGLGHLLRCISLAKAWKSLGNTILFLGDYGDFQQGLLKEFSVEFVNNQSHIKKILNTLPIGSNVIIDRYDLTSDDFLQQHKYVLIDDFSKLSTYPVSGVINFTLNAVNFNYVQKGAKSQALGLKFFLPHPDLHYLKKPFNRKVNNILVMIGSGDKYNLAPIIIKTLLKINRRFIIKVLGRGRTRLQKPVSLDNVIEVAHTPYVNKLYDWADFCVTSGGLAKYESAFLNKPSAAISLTSYEAVENRQFSDAGLTFDLGHHKEQDSLHLFLQLKRILNSTELRYKSYQKSLRAFDNNSQLTAASYVDECFRN